MNYNDKYPNAELWFQSQKESIMKGNRQAPCWHCGKLTEWVDIDFQAPLCSDECSKAKWNEYIEISRLKGIS